MFRGTTFFSHKAKMWYFNISAGEGCKDLVLGLKNCNHHGYMHAIKIILVLDALIAIELENPVVCHINRAKSSIQVYPLLKVIIEIWFWPQSCNCHTYIV